MTVGALQLSAVGDQDRFLIGNPSVSFFQSAYRRYSNWARQTLEISPQGQTSGSNLFSFEIGKSGDLICGVFLSLDGPMYQNADLSVSPQPTEAEHQAYRASYMPYLGIERVQVVIGGQVIDEMFGDYMQLWSELTKRQTSDQTDMVSRMLHPAGSTAADPNVTGKIYLPLPFWFCQNPGLAFPIIALLSQKMEIKIQFTNCGLDATSFYQIQDNIWDSATLLVDYLFVGESERRHFAQDTIEYLITTHQKRTMMVQGNEQSRSFPLDFHHPVRWLSWGMGGPHKDSDGLSKYFSPYHLVTGIPYDTVRITMNGQDREAAKDSKFYSYMIPYTSRGASGNRMWGSGYTNFLGQRQDDAFTDMLGSAATVFGTTSRSLPSVYSFSLDITQPVQPMGALNFSRLDSATLEFRGLFNTVPATIKNDFNTSIVVLAESYNVLRVGGGMAGLGYQS